MATQPDDTPDPALPEAPPPAPEPSPQPNLPDAPSEAPMPQPDFDQPHTAPGEVGILPG